MIVFNVNYYKGKKFSHKYREAWQLTKYHCPHCGKQRVWQETSGGDYYVGDEHICTNCSHSFYLPLEPKDISGNEQGKQRLSALKA